MSLSSLSLPLAQEHTFVLGRVVVDEKNDAIIPPQGGALGRAAFALDQEIILVKSSAEKDFVSDVLKAAFPDAMDGPTAYPGPIGIGSPIVETVDSFIAGLKEGDSQDRADWAKNHPAGENYPFKPRNYQAMRAALLKEFSGRDVLVLRYVHVR